MKVERELQAMSKVTLEMEKLSERVGKLEKLYLTLGGVLDTKVTPKMRFRRSKN